jgi:general secretion pathway protein J
MKKNDGFTLIELLVAISIFAIIAVIAYETISSLANTKQIIAKNQQKWTGLVNTIDDISLFWHDSIPLMVRDNDGNLEAALVGQQILQNKTDGQLELTVAGYVGNTITGVVPPKRVAFRYKNHQLYLIIWPVLNRAMTTRPDVELLLDNVESFKIQYLYSDRQWHDTWPDNSNDFASLPFGVKIYLKLESGEEVTRILAS